MKRLILSIVALAVSASPLAAKVGFLEPKPSNKNGIYYHSDIISLEEGEKFEVLLAEGRSSQDFALYIYKHDSDPSSEPISDTAESYLSHRTTESLKGETLYGPLKIFNVSTADPDSPNTRRLYRPIVQYRISTVEDLSLAALASGVENNTKGIAANVSSIATNSTTIADHELDILQNRGIGLETAADIARNSTTIADHEERITQNRGIGLETAADIAVNSTSIQANARDIATNGSSIQDNGTDIGTNVTAIAVNGTSIQDIATSVTTVATSVQDNAAAIVANGTGIQDIATTIEKIGTSVQDNATSIATSGAAIAENGTAIAGNGTSIQDIAAATNFIVSDLEANAIGIAANASSIAGNTTSIQDNTTGVDANVMLIGGNLSKIQLINQNIEGINRDLDLGKNERGRNVLEIGKNQLRFQALENQIGSLGSDAAFIQKLGDEFATKDDLTTAISEGKTQGINAVTSDPNNWNIFTADQIQEMAVGDLVLTREENGDFVLNYEIQQSDNAKDWTTYSAQAETITGLPVNKAFVRIRTR